MEIKITNQQQNVIFIVFLVVVCVFMVFTFYYMWYNIEAFTTNPITHGVKQMGLGDCSCICYKEGKMFSFSMNESGIYSNVPKGNTQIIINQG